MAFRETNNEASKKGLAHLRNSQRQGSRKS